MTDFSLRELECFVAVSEELSFTRAAERLRLAQPPLSRHIKNLEERLGVQLFERSKRSVSMTPGGLAFLESAREIMIQVRRASEAARRATKGEVDRLEVGFVSAVLSKELVEVFSNFRRRHPGIQLNLHDRLPSEQLDSLAKGDLDIGFIGVAPVKVGANLATTAWHKERLMAFLPQDHEQAGAAGIRLSDLADQPFVMISSKAAPAFTTHLRGICHEAGFRPRIVQEAARAQAVAAMTVAGTGVAILPESLHRITGNGVALMRSRKWETTITHSVAHQSVLSEPAELFLAGL